jgi:hypothetical protein
LTTANLGLDPTPGTGTGITEAFNTLNQHDHNGDGKGEPVDAAYVKNTPAGIITEINQQGVNNQLASRILATTKGLKTELEIYYFGSDDVRIKPGVIDISGTIIEKTSETLLSGETSLTGWNYVTINAAGTVQLRTATGTSAQRPTNSYFQYSGYDRTNRGYYYAVGERIIGAIYRVNATTWYIINCGENGAESGVNSNGRWMRDNIGNQTCIFEIAPLTLSSSASGGFYYASTRWTYPVPYIEKPAVSPSAIDSISGVYMAMLSNISASSFEYTQNHVDVGVVGTTASVNVGISTMAFGRYTDFT